MNWEGKSEVRYVKMVLVRFLKDLLGRNPPNLASVDRRSLFAKDIENLFNEIRPRRIIETGTYLGTGTTFVIASLLKRLSIEDGEFYSIEVDPEKCRQAASYLTDMKLARYVRIMNGLSVPRELLPGLVELERRYAKGIVPDGVYADHEEHERGKMYFNETNIDNVQDDLLGRCLAKCNFQPDFVLLDSAGHLGEIEFDYLASRLRGRCFIALDDTCHVKHYNSFCKIQSDPRFEIRVSSKEKFGYCIAEFST